MVADLEAKQLRELRDIGDDLAVLREQATPKGSFMRGLFQGAGAVLGGIIALALIGWILGLLGVIPGFSSFESYLGGVVSEFEHR